MPSIRKRVWSAGGKKRTAWLVDFKDKLDRRRAKLFSTLAEARAWADQTDLTNLGDAANKSMGDAAYAWLARATSEELENCTLKEYRGVVQRSIVPYVGHIGLRALTKEHVISFRTALTKAKSAAASRRAVHHLKMILNYAVDEEWVDRNVAHRLKSVKSARHVIADRLNIRIPTPEEQRKMLRACDRPTRGGPPRMAERTRIFLSSLMESAIRPSEARALP